MTGESRSAGADLAEAAVELSLQMVHGTRPEIVVAAGTLLLNDAVLKAAHPSWWTGKASDVAGLVVVATALAAPKPCEERKAEIEAKTQALVQVSGKLLEMRQRHNKYESTPYSLEPNCKESPGGLRDLQVLIWIARAAGLDVVQRRHRADDADREHDRCRRCRRTRCGRRRR